MVNHNEEQIGSENELVEQRVRESEEEEPQSSREKMKNFFMMIRCRRRIY
jgi:hypothetical protein